MLSICKLAVSGGDSHDFVIRCGTAGGLSCSRQNAMSWVMRQGVAETGRYRTRLRMTGGKKGQREQGRYLGGKSPFGFV